MLVQFDQYYEAPDAVLTADVPEDAPEIGMSDSLLTAPH